VFIKNLTFLYKFNYLYFSNCFENIVEIVFIKNLIFYIKIFFLCFLNCFDI
jgi:hypothetical protein